MKGKDLTSSSESIVKPMKHKLQKCLSLGKYLKEEEEQKEWRLKSIKGSKNIVGALKRRTKYIKEVKEEKL